MICAKRKGQMKEGKTVGYMQACVVCRVRFMVCVYSSTLHLVPSFPGMHIHGYRPAPIRSPNPTPKSTTTHCTCTHVQQQQHYVFALWAAHTTRFESSALTLYSKIFASIKPLKSLHDRQDLNLVTQYTAVSWTRATEG